MIDNDTLIVAIFKEIAVVQGKRSVDGQWTDANPWHVKSALEAAFKMVHDVRNSFEPSNVAATSFATLPKKR